MQQDDELRGIVERAFPGCQVGRQQRLSGGVSARATVVELTLGEGAMRRVVVRRPSRETAAAARRTVEREHALLSHCAKLALPSPRPLFLDPTLAALVLEHLPGEPDFAPVDQKRMAEQLASALARIHGVTVDDELSQLLDREPSDWRPEPKELAQMDESLGESRLRAALSKLGPWPRRNAEVLLHGDYWPGNVLWQGSELSAVLDWEESGLGDPLSDIAITRLDLLWAFGDAAMDGFTACYREQTDLDWQDLPRWDLRVALRPMSNLARWAAAYAPPPISRPDIDEPSMRAGHQRFVARALQSLREC